MAADQLSKVLEAAGLIERDKRAQWRTNSLRAAPLQEAASWMEHLSHLWDQRFDRLDAHLATPEKFRYAPSDGAVS